MERVSFRLWTIHVPYLSSHGLREFEVASMASCKLPISLIESSKELSAVVMLRACTQVVSSRLQLLRFQNR